MFKNRTLFIIGAGASAEAGLPIGSQLAGTISEKLDIRFDDYGQRLVSGDVRIFEQFMRAFRDEANEYQKACWLIRDGIRLSSSIDDFLDVHSQNERVKRVGKTAIVRAIFEAERSSKLFYDTSRRASRMNLSTLEDTWFIKFVRMLARGISLEKVETIFDNVAFIVFNYDRCIEHFIFVALQQLYSIDHTKAGKLLSKLCIIHPYGVVAELPLTTGVGVAFGGPAEGYDAPYLELSNRIRTYTEQIGDPAELNAIREQVSAAKKIVFLGFAFHDQNMQLLKPEIEMTRKPIFGTAFGMSKSDISVVGSQLLSFFDQPGRLTMPNQILLENGHRCSDVFDFYSKSLPV